MPEGKPLIGFEGTDEQNERGKNRNTANNNRMTVKIIRISGFTLCILLTEQVVDVLPFNVRLIINCFTKSLFG